MSLTPGPLVSPSWVLEYRHEPPPSTQFHVVLDTESGPHAYWASTLPTELYCQSWIATLDPRRIICGSVTLQEP